MIHRSAVSTFHDPGFPRHPLSRSDLFLLRRCQNLFSISSLVRPVARCRQRFLTPAWSDTLTTGLPQSPAKAYIYGNSFILWQANKKNRSLDQLTFRIALARQLIHGYSSRKRKGCPDSFQANKCVVPDDVLLASGANYMPKMFSNSGNVAEWDKKGGPATCVQKMMTLCVLQHASRPFMANNHH
ncbi:piggyBac transposable element-derived protein 4 [Trichonephila clavipes]|nr:piggyBac transposable element-derived protein 4 [Trichonephila clavipes]